MPGEVGSQVSAVGGHCSFFLATMGMNDLQQAFTRC